MERSNIALYLRFPREGSDITIIAVDGNDLPQPFKLASLSAEDPNKITFANTADIFRTIRKYREVGKPNLTRTA
jgi:hypothetical protein